MENVNGRTTKGGRKIIAKVKSYLVTTSVDINVGKLDKQGMTGKLFANVITKKVVKAGEKVCIRFGIKKFNGNYLVYLHSFGWAEVTNLEETFTSTKKVEEDFLQNNYIELTTAEKINAFKLFYPEKFEGLTKTETMLLGYLEGKDLKEIENEISVDKSLKYKIKKDTAKYENSFIKKLEMVI